MLAREEVDSLSAKHRADLAEMQSTYDQQLKTLRQHMDNEVHSLEELLRREKEAKLTELKKRLSLEQTVKEKELITKKESYLYELQVKLKEEKENEEALRREEKQDALRKIRNQVKIQSVIDTSAHCIHLIVLGNGSMALGNGRIGSGEEGAGGFQTNEFGQPQERS